MSTSRSKSKSIHYLTRQENIGDNFISTVERRPKRFFLQYCGVINMFGISYFFSIECKLTTQYRVELSLTSISYSASNIFHHQVTCVG